MGLMPIYQKPRTSIPAKGHKIYPYLLKGLKVERANQVPYPRFRLLRRRAPPGGAG
jgi:hypothetical protein